MREVLPFAAIEADDLPQVGGKGLGLGLMFRGGLKVPPGFIVTTSAYRRLAAVGLRSDPAIVQQIQEAYTQLGFGLVAVRSSATAEDGEEASFAGQQASYLGIVGLDAVIEAIEACWKSLHTERAQAYRQRQGLAEEQIAMAVVVQQLVPAEVAGVLFTRDPQDPSGELMRLEAAWGLGQVVVSGQVTPDRYLLRYDTGEVIERTAGRKVIQITASGEAAVAPELVNALCLSDVQLAQLADLARAVEEFYPSPRDVEWAIAGGELFILQARPITTHTAAQRQALRQAVIQELSTQAEPDGTVWVRDNLSEVLPEPTPMTWSVVRRLLAADGGFGAMNRDLGSSPDPTLGSQSSYDLIAGRPLCNLSRLPRMQFVRPPIEYPFAAMKADPTKALNPRPVVNSLRHGLWGLFRLPFILIQLSRQQSRLRREVDRFAEPFQQKTLPEFRMAYRTALAEDWSMLNNAELLKQLHTWIEKTLVDFARESLKPTVLAELCWSTLVEVLKPRLGPDGAGAAAAAVAIGARPPADCDFAAAIQQLSRGQLSRSLFLEQFGHRGREEMELSQPRWREDPAAVDRLARAGGETSVANSRGNPWPGIAERGKLGPNTRAVGARWAEKLRLYLGLREAAKHYLLLGYSLIRRALLELDRRFQLNNGIFFLTLEELPDLLEGQNLTERIRQRKTQRQLALSLELPAVLFSDDLEAIGRPIPVPHGAVSWSGVALSAGSAEAIALVVTDPRTPPPDEPYILVCPSTDPAWVPLFAQARGLVMETGGVLSHGAIVAREFGLPAVAGIPGLLQQLRTGQRLRVDGSSGIVTLLDHESPPR